MGDLSSHFSSSEFACRCGCGFRSVSPDLISRLELLRSHFGRPVKINSGCRCENHNRNIGGSSSSQHILGTAADIVVQHVHADQVADWLENEYHDSCGIGRYKGRTHFDVRDNNARWDNR